LKLQRDLEEEEEEGGARVHGEETGGKEEEGGLEEVTRALEEATLGKNVSKF